MSAKDGPRLFIGCYPEGFVYADRHVEVAGDYRRLGFLSYRRLVLEDVPRDCPPEVRKDIEDHAASIIARRGGFYQISQNTIRLGGLPIADHAYENHGTADQCAHLCWDSGRAWSPCLESRANHKEGS